MMRKISTHKEDGQSLRVLFVSLLQNSINKLHNSHILKYVIWIALLIQFTGKRYYSYPLLIIVKIILKRSFAFKIVDL